MPARCEIGVLRVLVQLHGHPFHDEWQELQSSVAAPLDQQTIGGYSIAGTAEQVGDQASRDNQARLRSGQRSLSAQCNPGGESCEPDRTAAEMLCAERMPHTHRYPVDICSFLHALARGAS